MPEKSKNQPNTKRGAEDTNLYTTSTYDREGSLAPELYPTTKDKIVDIVSEYPWCLNSVKNRDDIPYVMLKEYRMNESAIKRQITFYYSGGKSTLSTTQRGLLDTYDELFPRDEKSITGFRYKMPYFAESNMELTTDAWKTVDGAQMLKGALPPGAGDLLEKVTNLGLIGLSVNYPTVGIFDRPRIFERHQNRTINIEFPLYNTITKPGDPSANEQERPSWEDNRNFLYLFMNQNLFNKRDFATGISPCYYEVYVPGQFYTPAACVTAFKVTNLGHTRTVKSGVGGRLIVVPDAYQVQITLTDMIMASQNIWQAIDSGEAAFRVNVAGEVSSETVSIDEAARGLVKKAGEVVEEAGKAIAGLVQTPAANPAAATQAAATAAPASPLGAAARVGAGFLFGGVGGAAAALIGR